MKSKSHLNILIQQKAINKVHNLDNEPQKNKKSHSAWDFFVAYFLAGWLLVATAAAVEKKNEPEEVSTAASTFHAKSVAASAALEQHHQKDE